MKKIYKMKAQRTVVQDATVYVHVEDGEDPGEVALDVIQNGCHGPLQVLKWRIGDTSKPHAVSSEEVNRTCDILGTDLTLPQQWLESDRKKKA